MIGIINSRMKRLIDWYINKMIHTITGGKKDVPKWFFSILFTQDVISILLLFWIVIFYGNTFHYSSFPLNAFFMHSFNAFFLSVSIWSIRTGIRLDFRLQVHKVHPMKTEWMLISSRAIGIVMRAFFAFMFFSCLNFVFNSIFYSNKFSLFRSRNRIS